MPMLANVLLRTQGKNQLLVAATDLNVSLTAELKSNNTGDGGITLGAKSLHELIANAPGDEISLKKADNHWAEIKSGKLTYRIVGMPDRFPKVPDHREASYKHWPASFARCSNRRCRITARRATRPSRARCCAR
jgi:DNA polymerase-3 subunit beta